jgi:hypothetical protein
MSKASGAIRRAGNPRSFKSAYNRGQRIAAAFALVSMLVFSVKPAGADTINLAGGATTIQQTVTTGPNNGLWANYWTVPVLGTTGGVIGGLDISSFGTPQSRNEAQIGQGAINQVVAVNDAAGLKSAANVIDYTLQANRPAAITSPNNLAIVWTATLNVTNADTYNFFTASDDGTLLYIDGVRVVNNDFSQGTTERNGTIALAAGAHSVVIKYGQGGGGATNAVAYQSSAAGDTALAAKCFSAASPTPSRTTAR